MRFSSSTSERPCLRLREYLRQQLLVPLHRLPGPGSQPGAEDEQPTANRQHPPRHNPHDGSSSKRTMQALHSSIKLPQSWMHESSTAFRTRPVPPVRRLPALRVEFFVNCLHMLLGRVQHGCTVRMYSYEIVTCFHISIQEGESHEATLVLQV